MLRNFRILTLGAVVVLAVAGSAMVFAQGPGGPGPRGPRGGGPGIGGDLPLRALDLTEAQRAQVQQLVQQHREATRALFERVRTSREAQRQAMEAIPFDESSIRAARSAVAEVEADLAVQQARLQGEIHGLLTTEQQQRLEKIRADREARMKERLARPRLREQDQPRPQA